MTSDFFETDAGISQFFTRLALVFSGLIAVPILIPLSIAAIAPRVPPYQVSLPGKFTLEKPGDTIPATAKAFTPFAERLGISWDERFIYIESNGLPDHLMMIGITSWQQQVPLPQKYIGENAWRVPQSPETAPEPAMIHNRFLRGAIAIAVNGVPIFNPQNNRGEISFEIGELDQWGGHCGRADDYHYHISPTHLESVVGRGHPVAYALDGFPLVGTTEANGNEPSGLDEMNGHSHGELGYHYHASNRYPYTQAGFRGAVTESDGQVDPQPRALPVRPALRPLRGAKITEFQKPSPNSFVLSYEVSGEKREVRYRIEPDGSFPFEFDHGSEGTSESVYQRRENREGNRPPPPPGSGKGGKRPPGKGQKRPPLN